MPSAEAQAAQAAPATERWDVLALRYATLRSTKRELYHRYEAYGEPDAEIEMAYYFWVLRSATQTVLFDTGFDPAAGIRRGRSMHIAPVEALRRAGVEPESVSTIVVSHMHYDHIGNIAAFPQARLVVPRRELEFWSGPMAARAQFAGHVEQAEVAALVRARDDGRVTLTDGVEEILEGVTAHCVGGHSPGQLVIAVSAAGGATVVLASDAVHFYEEYELDRPFGVIVDLPGMYAAYDLLRTLVAPPGALLVPGHDPGVLTRFPVAVEDGSAVRLA